MIIQATRCTIAGLPGKIGALHAVDGGGNAYYAKTQWCSKTQRRSTAWLANECVYYTIARLSGLRMPEGTILEIDGELCWGSQFCAGRSKIPEAGAARLLGQGCRESKEELVGLARALLLDLALLNSDRKPWNILANQSTNGAFSFWYFDHDKALLGDAREETSIPAGDLGRIRQTSIADAKVADYFACAEANDLVLGGLTEVEIGNIFGELSLSASALEAARKECPNEWLSETMFDRLAAFLTPWWGHLHERFRTISPRTYLSSLLRDRGLMTIQLT